MRVAIVMPWGARLGGAESMLWTWLRHADRSRLEPRVIALQSGSFEREIAGLGIATTIVPVGRLRQPASMASAVRAIARELKRSPPDVIMNWSPKTQLYGASAASLAGLAGRVAWWQHGIPDGHWLDRLATALPARAVGCSSAASAAAQERLWPHRRTFVVYPGIEQPKPVEHARAGELREQLGIPRDRIVVGMVGRLQPWKGQDRLLRALALMRDRGQDVHGLIVGGDAYELSPAYTRTLDRLVRELGLAERVTMTGQVEQVATHVGAMDVFVSASEPEPFGIVLLEAMALSVPVLAVARGGPLEIIEPGLSGALVASGEPDALAKGLIELVGNRELRAQLGEGGRRVAGRFSAARMAESMQHELEQLVVGAE